MAEPDQTLLRVAAEALSTLPDEIGCDDCAAHLPVYAEARVRGMRLGDSLREVADHLDRCPHCREEYSRLRNALHMGGRG